MIYVTIVFALISGLLNTSRICYAEEAREMVPVYGENIKEGNYSIEVDSSSSMFRIVKAELQVIDGNMTAVITLSGSGYSKLYMGTGEEALEAEEVDFIPYVEDLEGAYTYTIPVEGLDKEIECTAFSKKKEKWYDRQLVFLASSLPKDVVLETEPAKIENPDLAPVEMQSKDGDYTMEISLAGGSGKATVTSPARISVLGKKAIASIEWSSPNYDYMIVNGQKYLPVNADGNSVFEIAVLALDQEIDVIANTIAMSKSHEISYKLIFHSDTMKKVKNNNQVVFYLVILALLVAAVVFFAYQKRSKNKGHNE